MLTAKKAELRRLLKSKDLEFVTLLNRRMLPSSQWLLTQKLGRSLLESQEDALQVIAEVGGEHPVTKAQFRIFMGNERLSSQCMDIVCKLFQQRDDRIAEVYHEVNQRRTGYQPYKRSVFLGNNFCSNLSSTLEPEHIQLLIAQYFPRDWKVEDTAFVVLLMNTSFVFEQPNIDSWSMIRIDLESHQILLCDPRLDRGTDLSDFAKTSLQRIRSDILVPVLRVISPMYAGNWPLSMLPYQYYPTLVATNESDCGVYIAACLIFSVRAVPVFIDQSGIARLRKTAGLLDIMWYAAILSRVFFFFLVTIRRG